MGAECFCIDSTWQGRQQHFAVGQQRKVAFTQRHAVAAFFNQVAGLARCGDEFTQVAPARRVVRQHHQLEGMGRSDPKLGARQQLQPVLFSRHMRPHHAGDGAFIGNGQRPVTQRVGARYQLFGVRGAALKTEIAERMQLGVVGKQTGHGCFFRMFRQKNRADTRRTRRAAARQRFAARPPANVRCKSTAVHPARCGR